MNDELRRALIRNVGETMRRKVAAELVFLQARYEVQQALAQLETFDRDAAEDRTAVIRERAEAITARRERGRG